MNSPLSLLYELLNLFLISIIVSGITFTVVFGSIFDPLREELKEKSKFFFDLLSCPLCFGTWVSIFVYFFLGLYKTHTILIIFFISIISFGFSMLIKLITWKANLNEITYDKILEQIKMYTDENKKE